MALEHEIAKLVAECHYYPYKFVMTMFPWGVAGTPLENYDEPDEWQKELLQTMGEEIRKRMFNGHDPVDPVRIVVGSGHGVGKAQPKSLLIDTPAGVRKFGEIKIGDYVFGLNGKSVKVIAIHEQGIKPVYRVSFDDKSSTLACGEHIWKVRGRQERRVESKNNSWRELTTLDILKLGVRRSNGVTTARQWELPKIAPVEYKSEALPVDPYILGLWLGDGGRNRGALTTIDWDIAVQLAKRDQLFTLGTKQGTDAKTIYIKGLQVKLRELGILDKYSYEKFIPNIYKYANSVDRYEVLRGLLDTDGEVNKTGTVVFSSTSLMLAKDVVWLARSLGGKARIAESVKKPFYKNSDGVKVSGRDCYRVSLTMPDGNESFYIKRKQSRISDNQSRYTSRWIESIERVDDAECVCITVDNADGMYLTNDFIPTHNSALTAWLIIFLMSTRVNAKGVVTSGKYEQLRDKTWSELAKWHKLALNRDWFDYSDSKGGLSFTRKGNREQWKTNGVAAKKENADAFAGLHNANSSPFYIFDEASAVPDEIYEVAEGGLSDGEPFIFLFGNVTKPHGKFIEAMRNRLGRWITRCIDSRKARMTNKSLIAQWINDYGIDSDFVKVRVRGMPPNASSNQLIGDACVTKARECRLHPDEYQYMTLIIGVDVARSGTDESVICVRQGRKVLAMKTFIGLDNIQLALRVSETYRSYERVDGLLIDEVGVGSGVVDYLRNTGYPVIGVVSGATAEDPKRFFNVRAEMWVKMKEWLEMGQVEIPDDALLHDQLTMQEYFFTTKEQYQLVAKKDMPASPDRADALAFTFARTIHHSNTPGSFEPD